MVENGIGRTTFWLSMIFDIILPSHFFKLTFFSCRLFIALINAIMKCASVFVLTAARCETRSL